MLKRFRLFQVSSQGDSPRAVSVPFRRVLGGLVLVAVVLGLALVGGCGGQPNPVTDEQARLGEDQLVRAQRLYSQMKREFSLHRDRKVLQQAGNLLDYYKGFPRNDEVLSMAVQAASRLEDYQLALSLTDEFLTDFPGSSLLDQRLLRGGEIALATGDTLLAAGYLVQHFNRDPERASRSDGEPRAAEVFQAIAPDQLDRFLDIEEGGPIWPYLAFLQVRNRLELGDYRAAEAVGDRMAVLDGDNMWLGRARDLLNGQSPQQMVFQRPSGPVNINRIGVLAPLTGRYAVLGNAFVDACLMALEKGNAESGRQFELLVEDSGGDPVGSALAARRLCAEDGCVVLFGPMMSDPTASAAVVADLYGVPLVSPTATNDRIWQLGDRIFQTNLTDFYEVRLLAQLGTTILLKERYGIIHPEDDEGRRTADVFAAEVEEMGGQVVARASFPPQGTDFREAILKLKEKRPEVIFAPGSVDQMVMLGPQLDFYRAGALIMGLSNWNSTKLVNRAGTQLERAIFASNQALIPPQWTAEFDGTWDDESYPGEAKPLARTAYQSLRMLLDTMANSGATNRPQLAESLKRRLANRSFEAEGPDSYAPVVRVFRDKRVLSFPSALFVDGWEMNEGAVADSTMAPDLFLPAPVEDAEQGPSPDRP